MIADQKSTDVELQLKSQKIDFDDAMSKIKALEIRVHQLEQCITLLSAQIDQTEN